MNLEEFFLIGKVSQAEVARAIGVPIALISQWKTGTRPVPASRCPTIERVTGGLVTCEELRPDVEWSYLRGTQLKALESINEE